MSEGWISFLQRWVVVALGVLVAAHIVPGIRYDTPSAIVVASLALGLLNALRPFLALLTLPLLVASLGLFWFVLNALLLWLVGRLVSGFHVDGFWPAFLGGLVISFVSLVVNVMTGRGLKMEVRGGTRRRVSERGDSESEPPQGTKSGRPAPGKGPVIDV